MVLKWKYYSNILIEFILLEVKRLISKKEIKDRIRFFLVVKVRPSDCAC